jgi:hypothetical protein
MTMPDRERATYPTTDTSLAAWLYSQGYQLIDSKRDAIPLKHGGKPTVFFFEKNAKIDEHIRQWQIGEAVGNCCLYEQAKKTLLNIVHTPRNGE